MPSYYWTEARLLCHCWQIHTFWEFYDRLDQRVSSGHIVRSAEYCTPPNSSCIDCSKSVSQHSQSVVCRICPYCLDAAVCPSAGSYARWRTCFSWFTSKPAATSVSRRTSVSVRTSGSTTEQAQRQYSLVLALRSPYRLVMGRCHLLDTDARLL